MMFSASYTRLKYSVDSIGNDCASFSMETFAKMNGDVTIVVNVNSIWFMSSSGISFK